MNQASSLTIRLSSYRLRIFLGFSLSKFSYYLVFSVLKTFPHKKDEALAMDIPYVESLPIAPPTDKIRAEVETSSTNAWLTLPKQNQEATRDILDWLQLEHGIEKTWQQNLATSLANP